MESKILDHIRKQQALLTKQENDGAFNTATAINMVASEAIMYNNSVGDLPDYDCAICKNKGYVAKVDNGTIFYARCACHNVRQAATLMRKSGIKNNTLFRNIIPTSWQDKIFLMANMYCLACTTENMGDWLYFGGQVGSGKTMMATAVVNQLMKTLLPCRYMLWRDAVVELKACVNDAEAYKALIDPLKKVKVLYIDDFFKTEQGKPPTQADINLAFEIINARYNNPELLTIITSERSIEELLDIDEAVGSRIYQKAREYYFYVDKDPKKNYRLQTPSASRPKIDDDLI